MSKQPLSFNGKEFAPLLGVIPRDDYDSIGYNFGKLICYPHKDTSKPLIYAALVLDDGRFIQEFLVDNMASLIIMYAQYIACIMEA